MISDIKNFDRCDDNDNNDNPVHNNDNYTVLPAILPKP